MDSFEIERLIAECQKSGRRYLEFVRVPSMSTGIFILPADSIDEHPPHDRDELYSVISGQGVLQVEGKDRPVSAGSVVFVPAGVVHHYHSVTEELVILVVFGGEISKPKQ